MDLGKRIIPQKSEVLVACNYFSAYAQHLETRKPETVQRHRDYVTALKLTGVDVVLGNFKLKPRECLKCGTHWKAPEEKETDVNIAVRLVSDAFRDNYDVAYVLSADTDLVPAIKEVRTIMNKNGQTKEVVAVFPPNRNLYVGALKHVSNRHINLDETHISLCRLPDKIPHKNGFLYCPKKYQ